MTFQPDLCADVPIVGSGRAAIIRRPARRRTDDGHRRRRPRQSRADRLHLGHHEQPQGRHPQPSDAGLRDAPAARELPARPRQAADRHSGRPLHRDARRVPHPGARRRADRSVRRVGSGPGARADRTRRACRSAAGRPTSSPACSTIRTARRSTCATSPPSGSAARRSPQRSPGGWPTSACSCSAPTAAPSIPSITGSRRSAPEDKRLFTDGNVRPGVEIRLGPDGEIFSRGPDLCLGYTDDALTAARVRRRRLVPHRRRRRARRRRLPHHHRPQGRRDHPRRREHQRARGRGGAARPCPPSPRPWWWRHPTPGWASVTAAVLRVRDGHAMPTLDEVRAHFKAAGVARQKWPEELHRVPRQDFPRTASGKVQKFRGSAEQSGDRHTTSVIAVTAAV